MFSFLAENAQRFLALRQAKDELRKAEATRLRRIMVETRIFVANLGTYLIPMVMGILGALTYILRSLSLSLKEHTYVPASATVFIVRVCLGAIAGVFGSVFVSGGFHSTGKHQSVSCGALETHCRLTSRREPQSGPHAPS